MFSKKRQAATIHQKNIRQFWDWFARNASQIAALLDSNETLRLVSIIRPQVKRLHDNLDWEIGPGRNKPYMLTITSKSNRALRPETDRVMRTAPELPDWEFYPALQPHEPSPTITLAGGKVRVETRNWMFCPEEDSWEGKLHITVVDDALGKLDRNDALIAVFIVLDALLGEDTVESRIGNIEIAGSDADMKAVYPIRELPGYLARRTF